MSFDRAWLCWSVAVVLLLTAGCSSQSTSADSRVFGVGERAQAGPLIYRVLDTEWREQIGDGAAARVPRDRFLLVRLSVTNSGASDSGIPTLKLVDSRGNEHQELSEGQGVAEWFGYLRTVKPAQTEYGRVLFDAPAGTYRLIVASDADPEQQKTATIVIPLQIGPSGPLDQKP